LSSDGDIATAVAPSLSDAGVDLYCDTGGSLGSVLAAAALRALGRDMLLRMWPRDDAERKELLGQTVPMEKKRLELRGFPLRKIQEDESHVYNEQIHGKNRQRRCGGDH
jgi:fructose-1,6-bisphosphatase/sedoheptulose 1,7-bisphosphatase-like protein